MREGKTSPLHPFTRPVGQVDSRQHSLPLDTPVWLPHPSAVPACNTKDNPGLWKENGKAQAQDRADWWSPPTNQHYQRSHAPDWCRSQKSRTPHPAPMVAIPPLLGKGGNHRGARCPHPPRRRYGARTHHRPNEVPRGYNCCNPREHTSQRQDHLASFLPLWYTAGRGSPCPKAGSAWIPSLPHRTPRSAPSTRHWPQKPHPLPRAKSRRTHTPFDWLAPWPRETLSVAVLIRDFGGCVGKILVSIC